MRIDREAETPAGSVSVVLSPEEAYELLEALVEHFCAENSMAPLEVVHAARVADARAGWETHIGQPDQLTIAIDSA